MNIDDLINWPWADIEPVWPVADATRRRPTMNGSVQPTQQPNPKKDTHTHTHTHTHTQIERKKERKKKREREREMKDRLTFRSDDVSQWPIFLEPDE